MRTMPWWLWCSSLRTWSWRHEAQSRRFPRGRALFNGAFMSHIPVGLNGRITSSGRPTRSDVVEHSRKNWVTAWGFSNLLGGYWQGFNLMDVKMVEIGDRVIWLIWLEWQQSGQAISIAMTFSEHVFNLILVTREHQSPTLEPSIH